jgi:enoyl-CoA hydratase
LPERASERGERAVVDDAGEAAIRSRTDGAILIVTIDRPEVANAIDAPAAAALADAMRAFDADESLAVAVLTGANGTFCAGADLKAAQSGDPQRASRVAADGDGPLGPTRLILGKPVIAAVEGHAVAGGLELALWCDLRVASSDAIFGVFCRRWGIPLMDGGTIRLPRVIGQSRALDMILTGRGVGAEEALQMGLTNRVVAPGQALASALELAQGISSRPQAALRGDRASAHAQWALSLEDALRNEYRLGIEALASGEALAGLDRYAGGGWRELPPERR